MSKTAWLWYYNNYEATEIYGIEATIPHIYEAVENYKLEIKKRDDELTDSENEHYYAAVKRSVAFNKRFYAGEYIKPENMPVKAYKKPDSELPKQDEFLFQIINGYLIMNQAFHDVIVKNTLGKTHFSQIYIHEIQSRIRLLDEPYYFINIAETRKFLNVADSDGIAPNSYTPEMPDRYISSPKDNDIVLEDDAFCCDVDMWHDPRLHESIFVSDKLAQSLFAAGFENENLGLVRCISLAEKQHILAEQEKQRLIAEANKPPEPIYPDWVQTIFDWADEFKIPEKFVPRNQEALTEIENWNLYHHDLTKEDWQSRYITYLPVEIGRLTNLKSIDLNAQSLTDLPSTMASLVNLKKIELQINSFTEFPQTLLTIPNLEEVNLGGTKITRLPDDIDKMVNLKSLDISALKISDFPDSFGNLKNLEQLDISYSAMQKLPECCSRLENMKCFVATKNKLGEFPAVMRNWKKLERIYLVANGITEIPEWIDELTEVYEIVIPENNIEFIPDSIGNLKNLDTLNMRFNLLKEIPNSITRLKKLRSISFRLINDDMPKTSLKVKMFLRKVEYVI